jgi:stearoyl-CoA desaturase (delta-9 desaturase)
MATAPSLPDAPHSDDGPPRTTLHRRSRHAYERAPDERINRTASIPFWLIHAGALLGLVLFGVSTKTLVLCLVLFVTRMWFITAGYHRYFAHRSYKTSRWFQFVLAVGGATAAQKGPLWWAGHHRNHHRDSDTERDIHSPLRGFWWSHVGWILCDKYDEIPVDRIKDFHRYPELRFVDKYNGIFPWIVAIGAFLYAGWAGLTVGFFLSTVLLWHNTFFVNSVAHVFGRRRYATEDTSRNNPVIAVLTLGEGWHNNHHYYQASARQGFFWWEVDLTYYGLKALSLVGVVRDLKVPSQEMKYSNWIKDGAFDIGMFRANWARAAAAVANTEPTLGDRMRQKRAHAGEAITHRREEVAGAVHAKKEALETFVHESLESAEELAKLSRRRGRDVGLAEP